MLSDTSNDQQIKEWLTGITNKLDDIKTMYVSPRIEVSLERFDNWFKYFNKIQNWRWMILDSFMPLALGVVAIIWIVKDFY